MKTILYIEACDFISFPIGGTLSFAKQLISIYNENEIKLVGLVNEEEPIGKWFTRNINGRYYSYFGFGHSNDIRKSKIPKRIATMLYLFKYIKEIRKTNYEILFTQTPQFVFVLSLYNWSKFCFCFAGLGNSVSLSRYKKLRFMGDLYEKLLFHLLRKKADTILAASDKKTIELKSKNYNMGDKKIIQFPTRFDEETFHNMNGIELRKELDVEMNKNVIVTTGRITELKGWKLILDSFREFLKENSNSVLIYVGDGESRKDLEKEASDLIKTNHVMITGFVNSLMVAKYLNISDVFVSGSVIEGWPTSIVEALACGCNIVSTNVSGIIEMVENGKNGFISENRDPIEFSKLIVAAIDLEKRNSLSVRKSKKYLKSELRNDFETNCKKNKEYL